tara:strand:- start:8854 stop:9084 length:231 start_codon:yes stop_codon:yes gene_type:complete
MSAKNFTKVFKQLKAKPVILKKYVKHNQPKKRTTGTALRRCIRCGRRGAHIQQYNLHFCRHCFREIAKKLEFKKYS